MLGNPPEKASPAMLDLTQVALSRQSSVGNTLYKSLSFFRPHLNLLVFHVYPKVFSQI